MVRRPAAWRLWRLVKNLLGALLGACFFGLFILASVAIGLQGKDLVGESGVLTERGRTTPGTVTHLSVDVQYDGDNSPTRTETVTVEFTTPDGARHTFSERGDTAEGTEVSVWYDPANPDEVATLHDPGTHRFVGILLIVVGVVFFVVGVGGAVFAFREWVTGSW